MDTKEQAPVAERQAPVVRNGEPRSLTISEGGVRTGADFANLMSALMGDIIAGRVTPSVGNAACNAGGKLLKVVEMQYRYGTQSGSQNERVLNLTGPSA